MPMSPAQTGPETRVTVPVSHIWPLYNQGHNGQNFTHFQLFIQFFPAYYFKKNHFWALHVGNFVVIILTERRA